MSVACTKEFTLVINPFCEDCILDNYAGTAVPHIKDNRWLLISPGWMCADYGFPAFDGYFRRKLPSPSPACRWLPRTGVNGAWVNRGARSVSVILWYTAGIPGEIELHFNCGFGDPGFWYDWAGVRYESGGRLSLCGRYPNNLYPSTPPSYLDIEMVEPPP